MKIMKKIKEWISRNTGPVQAEELPPELKANIERLRERTERCRKAPAVLMGNGSDHKE